MRTTMTRSSESVRNEDARRARVTRSAVPLVAALAMVLSLTCSGPASPPSGQEAHRAPVVAPEVALPDLDGKLVRLSDMKGRVVLVNFWATWCGACIKEFPQLKDLYARYHERGFEIVGIAMDDDGAKTVRPFLESYPLPFVTVIGNRGAQTVFGGVFDFPTSFLVGRDGSIVEAYHGVIPSRALESRIRGLLEPPGSSRSSRRTDPFVEPSS